MKNFILLLLLSCFGLSIVSTARITDKKPLTINDFACWKVLNNPIISNNGEFASFEINPLKGDGILVVKPIDSNHADTLKRGFDARFSPESNFIVFKIKQPADSVRSAKKRKIKKELMPKDSLGVLNLNNHKVYTFPNLKQYSVPKENGRWVAFLTDMKKREKEKEKKLTEPKKKEATEPANEQKSQLILLEPASGDTICFQNITEYSYSPLGKTITMIRQTKDSLDRTEVLVFDTNKRTFDVVFKQTGTARKIALNEQGDEYGFLFSTDTIKEKAFCLYYGSRTNGLPKEIVRPNDPGLIAGWAPSEFSNLSFSKNGKYLFFGTNRIPQAEAKDTLLEDEKPVLDIWTWKDKELQPEQKVNLEKEKKLTYQAVYLVEKSKLIQLCDTNIREIRTIQKGNGTVALGIDQSSYKLQSSWTGKSNADYYLVNVETGSKQLIVKDKSITMLSPGGHYVVWYNPADSAYYSRSTDPNSNTITNLTSKIPVSLCDEQWDMPEAPNTYGIAAWSENDKYLFLYDRYDIWKIDLSGKEVPVNATHNYGRTNNLRLRYIKLDPEEDFINTAKPQFIKAFDEQKKSEGFYTADFKTAADPIKLHLENYKFDNLRKSKNADILLYTRENVSESPNIWYSNMSFSTSHQLTEINPQQRSFVWPKVQLVQWTSFSGKTLEGLLYIPETMDPSRKYPMIVYFYERNADNLNTYTTPAPTRSTVNRSFYTSNDYVVFVPDITYEEGAPGKASFDAVVSGTQFICDKFPYVDSKKIGIQGQSWGGYQTAWIITQTNMFAAAMAGAPVSNMTSAYGGIRWATGVSRMFQYERDQSRIGSSLWDNPLKFIENSPLFYAPKIETPLLIMHNDNDGAVPWYQGIELFTAMRRLNKPAWMLTYNNEEHNLKAESWANRMDLTIRMKQFFDHYLKGAPMPVWMRSGIPAIIKGKELGY